MAAALRVDAAVHRNKLFNGHAIEVRSLVLPGQRVSLTEQKRPEIEHGHIGHLSP